MRRVTTGLARSGIGISISIVCIVLVLRGVDLGQTADVIRGARPAWLAVAAAAVVADLVYDPLETPLLKAAKARGLRTADGLGMLLHQAVGGFELWFGVRPQVTVELRALVEADLKKR